MFKINNQIWYIKFVPPRDSSITREDGSISIGACDEETHTIYIDETLRGYLLKKVICHEVSHAAMFSYGIRLTIEEEELLADLLATYGEEIITKANSIFNRLKKERG